MLLPSLTYSANSSILAKILPNSARRFSLYLAALDEIEVCQGDLEAAAYVLAINAGEEVVRSDPKWLDRLAQKCRRVICQEEFKDELLPDLSRELVAALIGYLVATGAFPVALATPVAIYVIKIGVKNFCKSSNS